MTGVAFTVHGDPRPQGSKNAVVRGGRAVVLEARTGPARRAFNLWRSTVTDEAWRAMTAAGRITPYTGPVAVELTFRLHRPKSARVDHRWKPVRPDLDKLTRAVLDALTGPVVGDDAQVVHLVAAKVLAAPGEPTGVDVTVRTVTHLEAPAAPVHASQTEEQPAT